MLLVICTWCGQGNVMGQVLEEYIAEGLKNNQQMLREAMQVDESRLSQAQAKGMMLPTVTFDASYTLAGGGRTIDFPVGDLLNPVYGTLNQLTDSDQFPQIANVNEQFLPNNFHETKIRILQPLFNSDIYYNRLISGNLLTSAEAKEATYRMELIKQIKVGYYSYLQAVRAVEIYDANQQSLTELVRFNEARFKADQITKDEVYRASYELEQLIADRTAAVSQRASAQAYFNFLLNKPATTSITIDSALTYALSQKQVSVEKALENRTEMRQLLAAEEAQLNVIKMARAKRYLPTLNLVTDIGYQGFDYTFDSNQDFWLVNISLNWNLFSGNRNRYQVQKSTLQHRMISSQQQELERAIGVEVVKATANLQAAQSAETARQKAVLAADRSLTIINSRYKAGQALLIEFLDAQSSLLTAQLNASVTKYQLLTRQAELDRVLAY